MPDTRHWLLVDLPNTPALRGTYPRETERDFRKLLHRFLPVPDRVLRHGSRPAFAFEFRRGRGDEFDAAEWRSPVWSALPRLMLRLGFDDLEEARAFLRAARPLGGVRIGADAPLRLVDGGHPASWHPGESLAPFFATRARAEALIGAGALAASGLRGAGVNVVVVDQGLSEARLRAAFPGMAPVRGWAIQPPEGDRREPGLAEPDGHGTMVARNILSLAPEARLFDCPLIPPRIAGVTAWVGWAGAVLGYILATILISRARRRFPGPWVICNAWGIPDRRLEVEQGDFTGNLRPGGHPFHLLLRDIDALHLGAVAGFDGARRIDQVFAAGNGGQFAPDRRTGPGDRGPGRSILGASSHPRVLSVGAVRADGLWLGSSSQGPGQAGFLPFAAAGATVVEKPDLCAPSAFVETRDGAWRNGGTSAACGIAAGAVAALRSGGTLAGVTPEALRAHLRQTASRPLGSRPAGPGWDGRLGHGILDLAAALRERAPEPEAAAPDGAQPPGACRKAQASWSQRLRRLWPW